MATIAYHKPAEVKKSAVHLHGWIWSDFRKKQSAKSIYLHKKNAEIGETETYLSAYFCKTK